MDRVLISLLFFAGSAMAKVRIGGSIGSIDDGWDAPATVKATLAFQIIWIIVGFVQLIFLFKNLGALPTGARGPYILLAVVTICFIIYNILAAVLTRVDFPDIMTANNVIAASSFFGNVEVFRPAVVLYLLHQRGDILRAGKANAITPLSTYIWKRVLDWVLSALAWIMYTAAMGVTVSLNTARYSGIFYDLNTSTKLRLASRGLGQTGVALVMLLVINLAISTIVQFVQEKGTKPGDLVTGRLLKVVMPLFILWGLDYLIFDIYAQVHYNGAYDVDAFNLADFIISSGITVAITEVLILTMKIPGAHWMPEPVPPALATPNWGLGQPYPPNAGWGQHGYNPQQPSQFYPTPHPLFQQMQMQQQQQQQYPYSSVPQPVPPQAILNQPSAPVPNQPAAHAPVSA